MRWWKVCWLFIILGSKFYSLCILLFLMLFASSLGLLVEELVGALWGASPLSGEMTFG